jgi:hypothetical protein
MRLKNDLKIKHRSILTSEEAWAKSVTFSVIKPRQISVWEFLIPIIFIMNWMKDTQRRDMFIQNLLFTKKLALNAAFDMVKNNKKRDEVIESIRERTDSILKAEEVKEIYSETIRECQMKEIELLIDHYLKLLRSDGTDYESLVLSSYGRIDGYKSFLETIKAAEQDVTLAAQETVGEKADKKMASEMKIASDKIRSAKAERIFK